MILDPILIYGYLGVPALGISGAAIATISAQILVCLINIIHLNFHFEYFKFREIKTFLNVKRQYCANILKIGFPPSIENLVYAGFSIILARLISNYEPLAIGVQRLGTQIESIAWMSANGFGTGVSAFVGQNFGAGNYSRIWQGFKTGVKITYTIGAIYCLILLIFPRLIFSLFLRDETTIQLGVEYMRIICITQPFLCVYMVCVGAFNGLGKSIYPSVIGLSASVFRIPMAMLLSKIYGLNGIWITISSLLVLECSILFLWFIIFYKKSTFLSHKKTL
jgi:putative MATE family efflux protein